ncbi:MAG: Uma2 family endonuclease [Bacteroidia bacterium]|nr:Uma2 family endonuclease [Bacteroidia bacterium]
MELISELEIKKIIESPQLNSIFQRIQKVLEDESKKREEFYNIIKENKVEFINGEIFFQSPVTFKHELASGLLYNLLINYVNKFDLGHVGHEKLLISLSRNDYEPDICFFYKEKANKFLPNQKQFPPPDFIIEVLSDSTEKNDRNVKYQDYAMHDVKEYWIIDPEKEIVEQYVLEGQQFMLQIKSKSGYVKSVVIKNFEIPIRAIFDKNENIIAVQNIIKRA